MKQKPTILNYLLPLIMVGLGLRHFIKHGVDLLTMIPLFLGTVALYLVVFNFPLLQRMEVLIIKLWYPVGQSITWVLLTVTFYLIFTPVGILLRLFKKDILNREFKTGPSSYWVERPAKQENDYTRQF